MVFGYVYSGYIKMLFEQVFFILGSFVMVGWIVLVFGFWCWGWLNVLLWFVILIVFFIIYVGYILVYFVEFGGGYGLFVEVC